MRLISKQTSCPPVIGCQKGTQSRQHLSLYVAHKLRGVAAASVPVAERTWYLFPAPEPLYCAPSPEKGAGASLSSVMSATRVALPERKVLGCTLEKALVH